MYWINQLFLKVQRELLIILFFSLFDFLFPNGDAVVDECGVCDGDGIADGACDCAGNVDLWLLLCFSVLFGSSFASLGLLLLLCFFGQRAPRNWRRVVVLVGRLRAS